METAGGYNIGGSRRLDYATKQMIIPTSFQRYGRCIGVETT